MLSGLLALVLVIGMLPPATARAEDTETTPTEAAETIETMELEETTQPVATETEESETEPEETEPEETEETESVETEPEETEPEETKEPTLPEAVQAVQGLIDALPALETVTVADYDAVQDAYDAFEALTEEEKTCIQGAEVFEALFNWFNAQTATLETLTSGTCGDNLTWTLDEDGTLTISGTGDMANYSDSRGNSSNLAPWYSWRSRITTVVMEDGVTSIGSCAFYKCYNLTSISIPGSVTSVGWSAFSYCSGLTSAGPLGGEYSIAFGWTTSIPDHAFDRCYSLANITIPDGITDIGNNTFWYCNKLTSITIPKGVTSIGDSVFHECNNLASVTIPDTVTSIGKAVFYGCESLTDVTIPESVTTIGDLAFHGCSSLNSIIIPEGVTSIGDSAFCGCDSLTSVTIPWSVSFIGGHAFWCEALAEIHFTHRSWDTLEIGDSAFYTNKTYRKLTLFLPNLNDIPDAISGYDWSTNRQEITYRAEGSRPVTSMTLTQEEETAEAEVGVPVAYKIQATPTGTTSDILWSIIPGTGTATVTRQGVVTGLTAGTVTVRATSGDDATIYGEASLTILPPTGGEPTAITITTGGLYENEVAVDETIPMLATFTPVNASERSLTWVVENGTGTAKIDEKGNLTGLTPGSVTVYATTANGIENSCTVNVVRYVESVEIFLDGKSDTTSLGVGETKYLTATLRPENTSTTGVEWSVISGTGAAKLNWDNNYYYDGGQTTVTWLTGTEAGTVTLCATAKDSHAVVAKVDLEITDTIQPYEVVGGNIYYNTETGWITGSDSTVTNAVIPSQIDGVTIVGIGPDAFANVNNSWHSYNSNTTLTAVSIPATVKEIGRRAFYSCTALSNLRFSGTSQLTTIGEHAFYNCKSLTSLTIPDSVTTVGGHAFSNLSGLKNLTIPGEADSRSWGFGYYGEGYLETITYTGSFIRGGTCTVYEEGYRGMEPGVFCYAPKLILSDSVTAIGDYAFAGVSGVTEVVLGANVTTIGKYAFANSYKITKMVLGDHVTTIGDYAFADSYKLTEVVLGNHVTTIGEGAFSGCDYLEKINLPDSLTSLGKDCFSGCPKLELLEVTALPERLSTNELCLTDTAQLPAWLKSAIGNQASLEWHMEWTEENNDPYAVADCYKRTDGKYYLYAYGAGTVTLSCEETYTGLKTSVTITVEAGLQIRPAELTCLTSGQSKQLSAYQMPAGTKVSAYWYLNDGDEAFATLTTSGKLTAKAVSAPATITVNAISNRDGTSATMTLTILPKATSVTLTREDVPLTEDLVLDMQAMSSVTLGAETLPEGALDAVNWATSNKSIATVEADGTVNLLKPGTVIITATANDGSMKSAKVKLTVYYVDEGKTLSATSDVPTLGLEPGQTAQITVRGKEEIPASRLIYSIPDSQKAIATVDENGVVTAGTKAGIATVTISLDGDPLKRKTTCKVKVIALQAQELTLSTEISEQTHDGQPLVVLDAADGKTGSYSFVVSSQAQGYDGSFFHTNVTWVSGNTAIATVKEGKDGTATVTVKKGASGECAITATTRDLNKVTATLWLSVRDYQPRLETTTPTMNLFQSSGTNLALLPSYENGIESVSLYEKEETSQHFAAKWEDGILTLTALEGTGKGTYTQTLKVLCQDGVTYPYTLKIKVTETAPGITVKQTVKPNLFYTDTTAALTLTATNTLVEDVEVIGGDFAGSFADGVLTLTSDVPNPGKVVTLKITVAGYEKQVEKKITLATVTTAPKLKLSATASTVNTSLSSDHSTGFQVLNGTEVLTLEEGDIDCTANFADWTLNGDDTILLTLGGNKGGTAVVNIQKENWSKAVRLTHRVTVQTVLPTLKLAVATLKLNRVFPEQGATTTVSLSQGNLTLSDLEITSTAKAGTALAEEAKKLDFAWDDETGITVTLNDDSIKTGTYAFSCVGTLETGDVLKAVTLRVAVSATNPQVRLASTTLRLNRYLAGEEYVSTKVIVPAGYTLDGFDGMEDTPLSYDNGYLIACLRGEEDMGGIYTLHPVLIPEGGTEPITLATELKVRVTTYHASALSATVSTKGKLDTLNPDSAITCTVNLKNCTGPIDGVSLSGEDGDLFHAGVDENSKVIVTMLEGQDYVTNKIYKVTLDMAVCGKTVSRAISFKVTQSVLKVSATPSTLTCYQAIGHGATTLKITSPITAEFDDVTVSSKTAAAFRNALGSNDNLAFDGKTGKLTLTLSNPALLAPDKNYTVYLDITPKGNAENVKPTQVTLTVKVKS